MPKDIKLTQNGTTKLWDISFDSDGDIEMTEGLETAVLMSILCEKRADADEITAPEFRRGDWSNTLNDDTDYEVGSKLWLLDVARAIQESANLGESAIEEGLQWMIDDNIIKSVTVESSISGNELTFTVKVEKSDNKFEEYLFNNYKITIDNN